MEYILKKFKEAKIPERNIEIGREYLIDNADVSILDNMENYNFKQCTYVQLTKIRNAIPTDRKDGLYNKILLYLYKMGYMSVSEIFYSIKNFESDSEDIRAIKVLIKTERWITRKFNSNCGKYSDTKGALALLEKDKAFILNYNKIKLFLYAEYFVDKYKNNLEDSDIKYYLKKIADINVLEEDRLMLEDYENTVIDCICNNAMTFLSDNKKNVIVNALRSAKKRKDIEVACKDCNLKDITQMIDYIVCAYVNFKISQVLKNVVYLALCISEPNTLVCIDNNDVRGDWKIRGGQFDEELEISPNTLLNCAITKRHKNVLRAIYMKHKDIYMETYEQVTYLESKFMLEVIEELEVDKKNELVMLGKAKMQNIIVNSISRTFGCADVISGFFAGDNTVEDIYKIEKSILYTGVWSYNDMIDGFNDYYENYGWDEFTKKVVCLSVLLSKGNVFKLILIGRKLNYTEIVNTDRIKKIYEMLDDMKIDVTYILKTVDYVNEEYGINANDKKVINDFYKNVYLKNKIENERSIYSKAFLKSGVETRLLSLDIYEVDAKKYKEEILAYFNENSLAMQAKLVKIISEHEEFREDVMKKLSSKKGKERELAAKILVEFAKEEDIKAVIKAYENENSEKIKVSMEKILGDKLEVKNVDSAKEVETTIEDIVQKLHKGNKKRTLEWAYETPFTKVHFEDGTECSDEYMQAIMLAYASVNPAGVSTTAMKLTEKLAKDELAIFVNELFDKWLEKGAEAKKRWVLYMSSIHGGRDIIKKLSDNIKEWPLVARGAIAADAVYALSLNPEPEAILLVDGFARKFKFKQVKSAASNALEFAANQLGISKAELEDRIVPTLGFDNSMERIFDYGARTFKVILTQTLELEVYDENGKKLKNMPAPGKKDDEVIAKESNAEFKNLKKQLKAVAESQKERLNYALSVNRTWTVSKWKELFVNNSIMHQFATGLIWGVYNNNELSVTFRYMEDGTFNTVDEEEYELEDNTTSVIGLVHPIELDKDTITTWKEQLEDYEIKQPIEQLDREIFEVSEEEKTSKELTRYAGFIMSDYTIIGKLTKLGWYKGSVQDAGYFKEFYREDGEYGAELKFEGCSVTPYGEDTTIYATRFYKAGNVARGSYVYDEVTDEKAITLCDVPKRYFSEIVLQLKQLTAGCEDRVID